MSQRNPAGIQAKFLGIQHQLFSIEAASLLQPFAPFADERNIVVGMLAFPIMRHARAEASRFIIQDLYAQIAFPIQSRCAFVQLPSDFLRYRLIQILPDAVPAADNIHHFHSDSPRSGFSLFPSTPFTVKSINHHTDRTQ